MILSICIFLVIWNIFYMLINHYFLKNFLCISFTDWCIHLFLKLILRIVFILSLLTLCLLYILFFPILFPISFIVVGLNKRILKYVLKHSNFSFMVCSFMFKTFFPTGRLYKFFCFLLEFLHLHVPLKFFLHLEFVWMKGVRLKMKLTVFPSG